MIVLKILLWILLSIIGIILLVCIVPADVDFSYIDGKMKYKIKLWFFDLMDSSKSGFLDKRKRKKKQKAEKKKAESSPESPPSAYDDDDIGSAFDITDEDMALPDVIDEPIDDDSTVPAADNADEAKEEKKEKKKKDKKEKKKKEAPVTDEDTEDDEEEKEKKPLGEKLEKLGGIWLAAKNPLAMIFKGFKFRNFYIDFIIADEDAYKCAIKYGRYSTLTYNGLSLFSRLFTIRFKTVDIKPGFGLDKGRWDTSFSVSFRLGTAVIAGIWFLVTYIFRVLIPKKRRAKKLKKTAAVQK